MLIILFPERVNEWKWGISIFYFYFNYQITACVLGVWDVSCDPNDTGCASLAARRKLIRQEFLQVQAPRVGVDSGIAVGKGWVGAHGVEPGCESVMVDALKHVQCWLVLNVFLCPFLCVTDWPLSPVCEQARGAPRAGRAAGGDPVRAHRQVGFLPLWQETRWAQHLHSQSCHCWLQHSSGSAVSCLCQWHCTFCISSRYSNVI